MRYLVQPIDREQNMDPLKHSPTVSNEIYRFDYRIRETLFGHGSTWERKSSMLGGADYTSLVLLLACSSNGRLPEQAPLYLLPNS